MDWTYKLSRTTLTYIRIRTSNSSKSNCESSELKNELIEPIPSNFRIGPCVEL